MKFYAILALAFIALCATGIMTVNRVHDLCIASGEITFSEQCREMELLVPQKHYEGGFEK